MFSLFIGNNNSKLVFGCGVFLFVTRPLLKRLKFGTPFLKDKHKYNLKNVNILGLCYFIF